MVRDQKDGVLRPDLFYENLLQFVPQLSELAEIEVEIPFLIDSAEMSISRWVELIGIIAKRHAAFDGIVITHGTDTLAYTASILSFAFRNLSFPLILTGAQRPLAELRSDARNNLINSVELACHDINEVAIMFDNKLMRGNRTTKMHITHFDDAFVSINYPLLAQVGVELEIFRSNLLHADGALEVNRNFASELCVLKIFPGCDLDKLALSGDVRAVILIGYGAGTVPTLYGSLLKKAGEWLESGKSVVLMSEARGGSVEPWLYESGRALMEMGVVSAGDITFEAAVAKLFYLLGNYRDPQEIGSLFKVSLAGEISGGKR